MKVVNQFKAYFYLSAAMFLVATTIVVGKILIKKFPVFLASELSLVFALILMLPVQYFKEGFKKVSKKQLLLLSFQALTGLVLFRIFTLYGLQKTSALEAGIITATTPAWIALLSFLFLREKLRLSKLSGILISVSGIILINCADLFFNKGVSFSSLFGNFLILLAILGESAFTIIRKRISDEISPFYGTTLVLIISFILFLPFSIYEAVSFKFFALSFSDWLPIVYYGFIGTVLAYIFWFLGVALVPAATAGIFTAVLPLSTLFLSVFVLSEKIQNFHYFGVVFVIAGILLSVYEDILKNKKQKD